MESAVVAQAVEKAEESISSFLLSDSHVYLFCGLVALLGLLRYTPLMTLVFTEKRKWLVAPFNVLLSLVGVFLLGLTPATTPGLKIIVALCISALATFSYELAIKRVMGMVQDYFEKKKAGAPQ